MSWTYAVLEIYEPEDGWPDEIDPSELLVQQPEGFAWCNGTKEGYIRVEVSLWDFIRAKAMGVWDWIEFMFWGVWPTPEFDEFLSQWSDEDEA